jgi:hypothetical protein
MNDLTDMQIKVLTEADIYRESGGQTEDDVNQMHNHAPTGHGSIPSNPNPTPTP